ncbi:MAG TPA: IS630 family transposase [Saprospiraceae bacterium]|nr:IS630 family transposase [Saprospiraceae bacterium]
MSRKAKAITLTTEDRVELERLVRTHTIPKRTAERAQIVLWGADGLTNAQIAHRLRTRAARVCKWRARFVRQGLEGLLDQPRSGQPRKYSAETERAILRKLDDPVPKGYAKWNGTLLAEQTHIPDYQVWSVLRKHGISLQRRRSWCLSTDPEFARKSADIVGLYLDPPENALVICMDEKPAIQVLERAQGWLKLPNGKALTGANHEYRRHGTTTLFTALNVATGQVKAGHYTRRRRREFLDFMNEVIGEYPTQEIHVIMDNLRSHKPKRDRWIRRHGNVHLHFTPTHASWLNQVEIWFSLLSRYALKNASFTSIRELRQAIDDFVSVSNEKAAPFEWTKRYVRSVHLKDKYSYLNK